MKKNEFIEKVKEEKLGRYNIEGNKIQQNEVGIMKKENMYKVYSTDERAVLREIAEYCSEGEALEHVLKCLRVNKRFELRRERK